MTKMLIFFFMSLIIYSCFFINIIGIISFFSFLFCKLIGVDHDIWRLSFLIKLICYSSLIGLGFALYLTNKELDNGMFQDEVNNGIKR